MSGDDAPLMPDALTSVIRPPTALGASAASLHLLLLFLFLPHSTAQHLTYTYMCMDVIVWDRPSLLNLQVHNFGVSSHELFLLTTLFITSRYVARWMTKVERYALRRAAGTKCLGNIYIFHIQEERTVTSAILEMCKRCGRTRLCGI